MRIKVCGKYWELLFADLDEETRGECDSPDTPKKQIRICNSVKGEEELEVLLHELLHAADWSKDEEWVEDASYDLAHILWKLGWKKGYNNEDV
tara:strand:+ start:1486 stop:1764 length:279 start_codon:yes stop_codon:yes gene_type:complete